MTDRRTVSFHKARKQSISELDCMRVISEIAGQWRRRPTCQQDLNHTRRNPSRIVKLSRTSRFTDSKILLYSSHYRTYGQGQCYDHTVKKNVWSLRQYHEACNDHVLPRILPITYEIIHPLQLKRCHEMILKSGITKCLHGEKITTNRVKTVPLNYATHNNTCKRHFVTELHRLWHISSHMKLCSASTSRFIMK